MLLRIKSVGVFKMAKTLVAIGDSITKGTYTSDTDTGANSVAEKPFAAIVAEALGYDFINCGMNGTSVSRTARVFPEHAMSIRIERVEDADILLVAAGTNDYGGCVELGSSEDRDDVSFYGGLDVFFRGIKAKNFEKVIVVTPIPRQDEEKNTKGYTLEDYRCAIEERTKEYGFFLIDGRGVPIDPSTAEGRRLHMRDGLHPNALGHRVYAEYVLERLRENKIV